MWKQWLQQDWVRAVTVEQLTQVHFADFMRRSMTIDERVKEQDLWWNRFCSPGWPSDRDALVRSALFQGFAFADRTLSDRTLYLAAIERQLGQVKQEADGYRDCSVALQQTIDTLSTEVESLTETNSKIVGSRTWRYGQRLATLSGYRKLRS